MSSTQRAYAVFALSLLLGSCGGSDSSPVETANIPPTFTSSGTAMVVENTTASFYTATAVDPEGTAVTFAISGGADAAKFSVTANGALSFASAPNFDSASDADGDNVYQVTLNASDGMASTSLALSVTVTNSKEGVQVRRIATGLTGATAISVIDSDRLLVADSNGGVSLLDTQSGVRAQLLPGPLSGARDGILAITRAPDFATTGTFFVLYRANGFVVLDRYVRNQGNYTPDNFGPIFATAADGYLGGGWLGIDGDAVLVGVSDGVPSRSQTPAASSGLGKVFRLTPNPDPFGGATAQFFLVDPIAAGFRWPVHGSSVDGQLYLGDRGESVRDEVDRIDASDVGNFGWPFEEGSQTIATGAPTGLIDPVAEYARGSGARDGQGLVGLVAYRGTIASLNGTLLALDTSGKVFAVPTAKLAVGATLTASALELRTQDFAPDTGQINMPVAIDGDSGGAIFILDGDGELYRLAEDGA